MNSSKKNISVLTTMLVLGTVVTHAQLIYKADNNIDPSTGGSWQGGVAPNSTQSAVWDSTVATAANCTNTMASAVTWGGILVSNPAAPVAINSATTSAILTLNGSGVNLSNSTVDVALNCPITVAAAQTWAVTNGHTLAVGLSGGNLVVNNNLTLCGYIKATATEFRINSNSIFAIPSGSTVESASGADTLINIGQTGAGTVNQSGGLVKLGRTTAYKSSLTIGSGGTAIYNLNGGQIIDTNSPTTGFITIGNSSSGTLNVNGGSLQVPAIQTGNTATGIGTINVTSGTVTTTAGDFVLCKGASGGGGALNVYGGTVSIAKGNLIVGSGSSAAGSASVYLTNGVININSSLLAPGGSPQAATVTIDGGFMTVTGSVTLLSSGSGNGTLNLNGGTLAATSVGKGGGGGTASFNFNGGTLQATTNHSSFIAATVPVSVDTNGAVIDNGGFGIAVPVALANGAGGSADGGLTTLGAGTLTLTAANSYNGDTVVSEGTLLVNNTTGSGTGTGDVVVQTGAVLGGTGKISGTVTVYPDGVLSPGVSTGTLTLSNTPVLNGITAMTISKTGSSLSSDKLVVGGGATLAYGGTLIVTATGNALAIGDTFDLFDAASFSGAFSMTSLPALPQGYGWDLSRLNVDGTIVVKNVVSDVPAPQLLFNSVALLNSTNLVMSGAGGLANDDYRLLTSTNLALPLTNWDIIATNPFDASGNFNFTQMVNRALSRQFFALGPPAASLSALARSEIVEALQNERDQGFNTHLASPGGLYINWIWSSNPPTTNVNINGSGAPDADPSTRHDRDTDQIYLACLYLYKKAAPADTQFDAEITKYCAIVTNDFPGAGKKAEEYWIWEDIADSNTNFNWYKASQADQIHYKYTQNVALYTNALNGMIPAYIQSDAPYGEWSVPETIQQGCILIIDGKARGLTNGTYATSNYVAAGEAMIAYAQSNGYSPTLKFWPNEMQGVFNETYSNGWKTLAPAGAQTFYNSTVTIGTASILATALCRAEHVDPGHGYGALATNLLHLLDPVANPIGLWDTTTQPQPFCAGYWPYIYWSSPSNTIAGSSLSVPHPYKQVGRMAYAHDAFADANTYLGAGYTTNQLTPTYNMILNTYQTNSAYPPKKWHGWTYIMNGDYSTYMLHIGSTTNYVPAVWVTSEAIGHAVRSLLYQYRPIMP
jgi:autotransporter-associated beta strand protein